MLVARGRKIFSVYSKALTQNFIINYFLYKVSDDGAL